jgi:hypothetical protein
MQWTRKYDGGVVINLTELEFPFGFESRGWWF